MSKRGYNFFQGADLWSELYDMSVRLEEDSTSVPEELSMEKLLNADLFRSAMGTRFSKQNLFGIVGVSKHPGRDDF